MSYINVDQTVGPTKAQVRVALLKKAAVRAAPAYTLKMSQTPPAPADSREWAVCNSIVFGSMPEAWVTMTLVILDNNGKLAAPIDSEVDAAVDTVWAYLIATARSTS